MSERVQALLLDSSRCKYPVIALSEIHRPSVIAMLIWHQRRVLSKVSFFPQVLDHGDGCVIQRHTSLAGCRFQLAHFHITAWLSLQAIPAPDLFYATFQVEDSVLQVDVTVEQT